MAKAKSTLTTEKWEAYVEIQRGGSVWSYGTAWGDQMEDAIRSWFALRVAAPASVLDVGCGEGRGVAVLEELGYDARGVDICEEKVLEGRSRGLRIGVDDFHRLAIVDSKSVDHVWASHCLEHALDIEAAIVSMVRVSRHSISYIIPVRERPGANPAHSSPIDDPVEFLRILDRLSLAHDWEERRRLGPELWGVIRCPV